MKPINFVCVVLLGAVVLIACGPITPPATKPAGPSGDAPVVTGTVTYLVRRALPPTAVIDVVLQDVSRMDVPAVTISSQRIEANGKQVPFPYELKYDPAQIDEKNTYAVRATIKDGDQLLFTSTTANPVITRGAPTSGVEIIVDPVASSGTSSPSVITGTVTYRNRVALPPTAVIEVTLQDISLADAPAKVISTQQIEAGGQQAPFAYELAYDPAQIDPRNTYSVSARITEGNELLFISDTAYLVLTRGAPLTDVDILVMALSQ
jgi:putative lipoprotein